MEIPTNITKEHFLKAIEKIDKEGIPSDADSKYYDVVFNGKRYPPKMIVSYANLFANGHSLDRTTFRGGQGTPSFKLLEQHGFTIELKNIDFFKQLRTFIAQAKTGDLKTATYLKEYQDLRTKVSFGQGAQARVPWMSFLAEGQTTSNGIYPVYLLYKHAHKLVLAYGVSETTQPALRWNVSAPTLDEYFTKYNLGSAEPYPNSYVYKMYDLNHELNEEEINKDLNAIIKTYKKTLEQQQPQPFKSVASQPFNYTQFVSTTKEAGLVTTDTQCLRFISALLAKPFVIFTGLSGSGKTKLAQAFAKWICAGEDQYKIIPVGADWTNREPLFGFPNALQEGKYILPDSGALQLILKARDNAHKPYFLVLDEMNLSHVERYFADFLSAMESGEEIPLHSGNIEGVPAKLKLPTNLFLVGTVNIDETTYMFSPKVLDRASVIEFRVNAEEMNTYLNSVGRLDLKKLEHKGAAMAGSFLNYANDKTLTTPHEAQLKQILLGFFKELQKTGAEFGFRTASEIIRFAAVAHTLNPIWSADEVTDAIIMQKLLPKVHGSRRKLEPVLKRLAALCMNDFTAFDSYMMDASSVESDKIKYPVSLAKIARMYNALFQNGFASYAEA